MRKAFVAVVVIGILFLIQGCAFTPSSPVYGSIVTSDVKGPVAGVDNSVQPAKKGEAESEAIIFFARGDSSISAAMEEGNIEKVHHVDCETFSILGIYGTYKTIVYGE